MRPLGAAANLDSLLPQRDPGSFRDRNGAVYHLGGGTVLRGISASARRNWEALRATTFFSEFVSSGRLIRTETADISNLVPAASNAGWAAFLRHERIPFISYPYEWCFGMLKDAALLQLDLLLAAFDENMILKDASAFNVQWNGSQPVFIDIPSLEVMKEGQVWTGYRQFCEMFLNPLMLQAYKKVPFQPWLSASIDGIPVEHMASLISLRDLLRPGILTHVYLHNKLQQRYQASREDVRQTLRRAGLSRDMIKTNVSNLKKLVSRLSPKVTRSPWSDYAESNSYGEQDLAAKKDFVRRAVGSQHWDLVWDLGANTGVFSEIAAQHASYVVAMDADVAAVERLYQEEKQRGGTRILPLVINLANPSSGRGWRSHERQGLAERGTPQLVLALALIHHLVISANIPLRELVDWLASFRSALVIEFVTKEDEMVQTLLRHKDDQYDDYRVEAFESYLEEHYEVIERVLVKSGSRCLYFARPRP